MTVGHNTVALLMRRAGLTGLPLQRRAKRVPSSMTVTDLVRRQFARPGLNQLWVTDITEHPTHEGKGYCCVVIDTFSRRGVAWAIDSRARAIWRRWNTRIQLANAIFEYIEGFHNRRRRHSALGWTSPIEFEDTHAQTAEIATAASP